MGFAPSSMQRGYQVALLANYISNSKYNLLSRKNLYFELYVEMSIQAISPEKLDIKRAKPQDISVS